MLNEATMNLLQVIFYVVALGYMTARITIILASYHYAGRANSNNHKEKKSPIRQKKTTVIKQTVHKVELPPPPPTMRKENF